jgi:hypothetical protein
MWNKSLLVEFHWVLQESLYITNFVVRDQNLVSIGKQYVKFRPDLLGYMNWKKFQNTGVRISWLIGNENFVIRKLPYSVEFLIKFVLVSLLTASPP